jgi:hypothetical protein
MRAAGPTRRCKMQQCDMQRASCNHRPARPPASSTSSASRCALRARSVQHMAYSTRRYSGLRTALHATCNPQRATCNPQRATCSARRATWSMQHATCGACADNVYQGARATTHIVTGAAGCREGRDETKGPRGNWSAVRKKPGRDRAARRRPCSIHRLQCSAADRDVRCAPASRRCHCGTGAAWKVTRSIPGRGAVGRSATARTAMGGCTSRTARTSIGSRCGTAHAARPPLPA